MTSRPRPASSAQVAPPGSPRATQLRTDLAGALRREHAGSKVTVAGWIHRTRNLGGIVFADLRDRAGIVQVSFDPKWTPQEVIAAAADLGQETVVAIDGEVGLRPEDVRNPELSTGDVEVRAASLRVLSPADTPPIPVARGKGEKLPAEELRLRYRHLDLRRSELQANIILRHRLQQATRRFLDEHGFLEIETPVLTKPTPEGARDYLVPSRVHPGEFYALPQSPQLYKQLLMVAGFDRYFQIARCFRDEDLRADRQPEFTQIDIEASFVGQEDVMRLTEGMLSALFAEAAREIPASIGRLTYRDAMERYGSDRPDTRYELEIFDATDAFRGAEFGITRSAIASGGRVRGIRAAGAATLSRKQVDEIESVAKAAGASGLLRLKRTSAGLEGPVAKYIDDAASERLALSEGDLCLLVAAGDGTSSPALDRVRQELARTLGVLDGKGDSLVWITDFPLFTRDSSTNQLTSVHHPFTSPNLDDVGFLEDRPDDVRALAYDVVMNGTELGGGSIRINDPRLQRRVFSLLGIDEQEAERRFGFLLEGLRAGAPPHGGIAFGFDRIVMLLAGAQSLRDVIAFPKTTAARALFEGAPSPVNDADLAELHISSRNEAS